MLFTPETFRSVLAMTLLALGVLFIGAGFFKLVGFGFNNHARTLAAQSAKLGQKSITNDITHIVQAAVQLNESVNNLLRTSMGVGAFLIIFGAGFITASYAVMFVA